MVHVSMSLSLSLCVCVFVPCSDLAERGNDNQSMYSSHNSNRYQPLNSNQGSPDGILRVANTSVVVVSDLNVPVEAIVWRAQ
mgnify:CR=1 FL=1